MQCTCSPGVSIDIRIHWRSCICQFPCRNIRQVIEAGLCHLLSLVDESALARSSRRCLSLYAFSQSAARVRGQVGMQGKEQVQREQTRRCQSDAPLAQLRLRPESRERHPIRRTTGCRARLEGILGQLERHGNSRPVPGQFRLQSPAAVRLRRRAQGESRGCPIQGAVELPGLGFTALDHLHQERPSLLRREIRQGQRTGSQLFGEADGHLDGELEIL